MHGRVKMMADSLGGFPYGLPFVFWNEDYINSDGTKGTYMMYYCTSSTYKRSAIGYAVSNNIEGPYTYVDTLVYSGFTSVDNYDGKSSSGAITLNSAPTSYSKINTKYSNTNIQKLIANGTLAGTRSGWFNNDGSYNTSSFPNAIDPGLFYDKDGKLWMSYGSWSGGIFVLQIDKTTGKAIYPGKEGTPPEVILLIDILEPKLQADMASQAKVLLSSMIRIQDTITCM